MCPNVAIVDVGNLHTMGVDPTLPGCSKLASYICVAWRLVLPHKRPFEEKRNCEGMGPKRTIFYWEGPRSDIVYFCLPK